MQTTDEMTPAQRVLALTDAVTEWRGGDPLGVAVGLLVAVEEIAGQDETLRHVIARQLAKSAQRLDGDVTLTLQ
jgi:hypothetical protein